MISLKLWKRIEERRRERELKKRIKEESSSQKIFFSRRGLNKRERRAEWKYL
jgi:hypothetical protein